MKNTFLQIFAFAFLTMISAQEKKYAAFVVDDTGSMANEIEAVKKWIGKCVSERGQPDSPCANTDEFVLTTFNDPTVGPVTGPTDAATVLNNLAFVGANGGGDCPELLYQGLENAVNAIPERPKNSNLQVSRCKAFVFTDATAKDPSRIPAIGTAMNKKGCVLVLLLTGCCGKCPNPCESVSEQYCINKVIDNTDKSGRRKRSTTDLSSTDPSVLLFRLAESTGGSIIVMEKPKQPEEMVKFLEEKVSLGFCASDEIAGPSSRGYLCETDCVSRGMCWDKSVGRCFCNGTKCARERPQKSTCPDHFVPKCTRGRKIQFLPDGYDCSKFHICLDGNKWSFKCSTGKVYTGRDDISCDIPEKVRVPCGTLV